MTADLSRIRFDPLRDHAGVGIQQGRLWLDADFNEQVAISDRRDRAQVVDLAPAPTIVSRETPDAFHVAVSGGTMTIAAGRMYVDGLLAENHGTTVGFDPVLAEPNGTDAVDYAKQPYRIDPDPLPSGDSQHLVILDVWNRDLDHLNTPDLIEAAVGHETTTRVQTVWQVRVLPDVGTGLSCDSAIDAYDKYTAPSSARLSTGTAAVDPATGPCEIPPGTGYRGWENATYRVELHSPTEFKWSNTNASVASAVTSVVSASKLQLATLGRDDVLAMKSGDWVEITDDRRELEGQPGEMRQVTVEDGNVITFSPALPADLAASTAHLRVRKWNSGLVTIPADGSAVTLEYGVTVTFSFAATGAPRVGDHWVFAARVPGAWLEPLTDAAPRGIHHHYARLALISTSASPTDCRTGWPATDDGCGCEICVSPDGQGARGLTVQAAVDRLVEHGGGTLTLCPGRYVLDEPVMISGAASVRIRGAGRDSVLIAKSTAGVVVVQSRDVTLEDFAVTSGGDEPAILLAAANQEVRLHELWVSHTGGVGIGLAGAQSLLTIADCIVNAVVGIGAVTGAGAQRLARLGDLAGGEKPGLLTLGLTIADNWLSCRDRGIDFGIDGGVVVEHAGSTTVRGNHVRDSVHGGVVATGLVPRDLPLYEGTLEIRDNLLEAAGPGIVTGGRARIEGNTVYATIRATGQHGIALIAAPPDTPDGIASVLSNTVTSCGGYGVSVAAPMRSLLVEQNIVRGTAGGILVQPIASGGSVAVGNNQVLDLAPVGDPRDVAAKAPISWQVALVGGGEVAAVRAGGKVPAKSAGRASVASARAAAAEAKADQPTVAGSGGKAGAAPADQALAGFAPGSAPPADPCPDLSTAGGPGPYLPPVAGGTLWRTAQLIGIGVVGLDHVTVVGNTVDGVGADVTDGGPALARYGIAAHTCVDVRIAGNTVARVGSAGSGFALSYGIACGAWQETVNVSDNIVSGGNGAAAVARTAWTAIWLGGAPTQKVAGVRTVTVASGYYTFLDGAVYQFASLNGHVELVGNTTHGGGEDIAVVAEAPGDVVMTGNRCTQPAAGKVTVVGLSARTALVQGNRVYGGEPSVTVTATGASVVLGNITSGSIHVNGVTVAADALNPIG
jgi:Family of unknown function (DUF6519)